MNDLLSPQKAILLSGRHFRRREGRLETSCPKCEGEMWIHGNSFVCPSTSCDFNRGSSIDFLAADVGGYVGAINAAAEAIPYYRDVVQTEAAGHQMKRQLLEFAFRAEQENRETVRARILLRNEFAARTQVPSGAFLRGHWYLTDQQSDRLVLLLSQMGYTPPPNLQGKAVAVAPFWANLHTLSALYVSRGGRDIHICDLHPAKYSWFGLQQMAAGNQEVMVHPTYKEAMQREEYFDVCERRCFPTSLHVNPRAGVAGMTFASLRFKASLEEYLSFLPRWSLVEGFEDAEFEIEEAGTTRLGGLLQALMNHCASSPLDFTDMCAAMTLSTGVRADLMERADTLIDKSYSREIQNTLSRRLLTFDEKGAIYECPDGYYASTSGSLRRTSNFTIELEKMICFSSLTEARYVGKVRLGTMELPIDVTGTKMENNRQLEEMIRSAQTMHGYSLNAGETATIFQDRDFRRVMEVLRVRRAELQRFVGVSSLGWNHRFDTFFFPGAIIDAQGIHGNVSYHSDPAGDHHCYNSEAPLPSSLPDAVPDLNPVLAELVSCMLSQVIRMFYAKPVRLWPVKNNEGRDTALKLFQGFGQDTIMRLTHFQPRNFDLNKGMPCLATVQSELQAGKARLVGLYLSEYGPDFTRIPEEDVEFMAGIFPSLVAEIASRLIAGKKLSYKERRSVDPMSAVALEGAELIRNDFWGNWPLAGSQWNAINLLLEEKEFVIPRAVQIENGGSSLLFPHELWKDLSAITTTDLLIEMGRMNLRSEETSSGIRVDRATMNRVFTDFYGQVPEAIAV